MEIHYSIESRRPYDCSDHALSGRSRTVMHPDCNAAALFRRRFGRGVHAGDAPRHTPLKRVYECFLYPALQGSIAFLESQFANDCSANGHRFVVFGDFRLGAAKTYAGLPRSFLYAFSDSRPDHDERAAKRFREWRNLSDSVETQW